MPDEYAAMFRTVLGRVPGSDGWSGAPTATMTSGSQWPTRSRPSPPGPARWSAPSTASENGPAMRRWRRSSSRRGCAPRCWPSAPAFRPRRSTGPASCSSNLTGIFPQPNKAIVGRNAFAHEAGIHQHGMLQNGLTYEIIRPESVGIPRSTLVLGQALRAARPGAALPRVGLRTGRGQAGPDVHRVHRPGRPQAGNPRRGSAGPAARELPRRAGGIRPLTSQGGLRQRLRRRRSPDDGTVDRRAVARAGREMGPSPRRSAPSARSSSARWR